MAETIESAIAREKQIKGWVRRRKGALIESLNPYWVDLAGGWVESPTTPQTLRPDAIGAQGDMVEQDAMGRGTSGKLVGD